MSLVRKSAERETGQDVKEKRCYFSLILTSTAETDKDQTYLLQTETTTTASAERPRRVEVLFQRVSPVRSQRIRHFLPEQHEV